MTSRASIGFVHGLKHKTYHAIKCGYIQNRIFLQVFLEMGALWIGHGPWHLPPIHCSAHKNAGLQKGLRIGFAIPS